MCSMFIIIIYGHKMHMGIQILQPSYDKHTWAQGFCVLLTFLDSVDNHSSCKEMELPMI